MEEEVKTTASAQTVDNAQQNESQIQEEIDRYYR